MNVRYKCRTYVIVHARVSVFSQLAYSNNVTNKEIVNDIRGKSLDDAV